MKTELDLHIKDMLIKNYNLELVVVPVSFYINDESKLNNSIISIGEDRNKTFGIPAKINYNKKGFAESIDFLKFTDIKYFIKYISDNLTTKTPEEIINYIEELKDISYLCPYGDKIQKAQIETLEWVLNISNRDCHIKGAKLP